MKPILCFFCTVILLIMVTVHTSANTNPTNDNNLEPTEQATDVVDTSSQSEDPSSDETSKVISISVVFLIAMILLGLCIITGAVLGITGYICRNKYFSEAVDDKNLNKIKFYLNKHTIFRRFALMYSVVHYVLNILSIVTTLITVYMVVDTPDKVEIQIIFLLLAAIFSSLSITLRFDKIGGCYAQAMRVLEKAILTYLADLNKSLQPLVEANTKAEQIIEITFF